MAARALAPRRPDPPAEAVASYAEPAFAAPRADRGALTATWVGHSTFLLQIGGLNVLTDPVWAGRASPLAWAGPRRWARPGVALEALPPVDLVVQSHDHYDHLDADAVRRLAARADPPRWVAPLGVGARLGSLGARAEELDWWQRTRVPLAGGGGWLELTAVPAQHFSGRGVGDRDRTLWCGWVLRVLPEAGPPGRAAYFVGDTGLHPEFGLVAERAGPFDLVLMPVGAYDPRWFMAPVHLAPEEAVRAHAALLAGGNGGRPCTMAAMHWGTFKLTDEPMDEPPRRTRAAWAAAGLRPNELWVPRVGETLVR
jgi:N-acyl-phosphatidylethanolamine-hydrolysing phospholipase D